jgi:hypothetical protein
MCGQTASGPPLGAVALVLTAGCGSALAATLYVDQRFGPGGN